MIGALCHDNRRHPLLWRIHPAPPLPPWCEGRADPSGIGVGAAAVAPQQEADVEELRRREAQTSRSSDVEELAGVGSGHIAVRMTRQHARELNDPFLPRHGDS